MNNIETKSRLVMSGVILLIPIFIGRIQEIVPFLIGLPLAKISIGIALLLFLFDNSPKREGAAILYSIPQGRNVLWLLAFGFISVPFSVWPGGSFGFMIDFLKNIFFVYLLISCAQSEHDVKNIVWMLILTVFVLVLFSVFHPRLVEDGRVTVSGTYDPNDFALLLVMTTPLIYFLMEQEFAVKKFFLFCLLLATIYAVLKTGSRGGLLSLLTVFSAILYRKGISYAMKVVPVIIVFALVLSVSISNVFWDRFSTIMEPSTDYNNTAKEGRVEVWKRGLDLYSENLVLGTGAGAFTVAEGTKHEGGKWSAAHNSFIQVAAELGTGGLILFCLMLFNSIKFLREHDANLPWLRDGLVISFYGFLVGGFFLSWAYWPALYFFIGLSILYGKVFYLRSNSAEAAG